jgi:chromosome transmission fidelity protein 18
MSYPTQPFQDDNFLTKPNAATSWLHFYDQLSTHVSTSQDWEVAPYLSSAILAFHHLFAVSPATHAFDTNASGSRFDNPNDDTIPPLLRRSAPYIASESQKANAAAIAALQSQLSLQLLRLYSSRSDIATELLPYVLRLLAPAITPVVITTSAGKGGASISTASVRRADEKERVARAVECMVATGVRFDRSKVETEDVRGGGWVYRMEPALDGLAAFEGFKGDGAVRYAVRQVLEGEWRRREAVRRTADVIKTVEKRERKKQLTERKEREGKRDFFGRVIEERKVESTESTAEGSAKKEEGRVWVSYHEGFSNAVRRPVTLEELMREL